MAQVDTGGDSGGGKGKHQKKRAKKASTHIDMTPMVDLAFLLLTFFVLTSTFSKPKAMEIPFPADPPPDFKPPKIKNALTFLLSDEKIFYYKGEFFPENNTEAKPPTQITETSFDKSGIRELLLKENENTIRQLEKLEEQYKRKEIDQAAYEDKVKKTKSSKEALTVLIKADDKATYKNFIDIVDEMNICRLKGKYVVTDMIKDELDLINKVTGK